MLWMKLILLALLIFSLSGCATTGKEAVNLETEQLKARVSELEEELKQKDEMLDYFEAQLRESQKAEERALKEKTSEKSSKLSGRQIQTALKNAGFYNGPIDGKIGKQTRRAIRQFQKAQGLPADGLAGAKTCLKLKNFLK